MKTPTIKATFELDENGRPAAVSAGKLQHYRIKLQVDGAPPDTYAVTYVLDPSYHSPVREVRNSEASFEERLTSYGDYTVQAKIRSRDGITTIAVPLSKALLKTYSGESNTSIDEALQNIISR
jgi:flavin-binding protein dodecin